MKYKVWDINERKLIEIDDSFSIVEERGLGVKAFSHFRYLGQSLPPSANQFTVTEAESGAVIGSGITRSRAVIDAKNKIRIHGGPEAIRELISVANRTRDQDKTWACANKLREDNA